ncbi:MAG: hypothetical protein E6G94_12785 [Alphaproteobacteria bacterium]|nr:MAG: hypothetical protein E6G94_12785 [Alphaproteobacteria bacterium]
MTEVERADRMSRGGVYIKALAAAVLLLNVWLQYGDAEYSAAGPRGGSWLVLIGLWVVVLWTGGGFMLSRRLRSLLNDELSLQNRSRALAFGFYAALALAMLVYVANWYVPVATGDAMKIVSAGALSAALLCYAWLEWRWR